MHLNKINISIMGMCCLKGSSKRNEGVRVMNEILSADYSDKKPLCKEDIKIIYEKIIVLEYNTKLYEKRDLQAQRAKLIKSDLNEKYLELIRNTRKLEDEINSAVKSQVIEEYQIPLESFESIKELEDTKEIIEAAIINLHRAIRRNKNKLGITETMAIELIKKYQCEYDKCNFMLSSIPELAKQLSVMYDENQNINYIDIMTADSFYYQFKLLPIEIQAFIEDN